jgi:hypothetical protein
MGLCSRGILMESRAPEHRPFQTASAAFEIGLKPMPFESWLETGPDHAAFMQAKRARLAGLPPLFYGSLPSSAHAQAELLERVTTHLVKDHSRKFTVEQGQLHDHIDDSTHDLSGS